MPSPSSCSDELCSLLGFLGVILPIVGCLGVFIALYAVVRFWTPISRVFRRVCSVLDSTPEMSLDAAEKGRRAALGEPQTFQPNFFFLRQNSLNDAPKITTESHGGGAAVAVNGAVVTAANGAVVAVEEKRRMSKSHPACSPTFQTDPIDWADLGVRLPKEKQVV